MEKVNKNNWLILGKAQNQNSRKLALEMIPFLKKEIQEELFIWYHYNLNPKIQETIFQFLNLDFKERIKQKHSLVPLEKENLELETFPERLIISEMIKSYIIEESYNKMNHLPLVKDYLDRSEGSLNEASIAIWTLKVNKGDVIL